MKLYSHTSDPSTTSPASSLLSAINLHGSPSLVLDVIKRGEDDEDVSRGEFRHRKGKSIILRIYDSLGGQAHGTIEVSPSLLPVKGVWKCNVLEDDEEKIHVEQKGKVEIRLRAFEVATYRLQL